MPSVCGTVLFFSVLIRSPPSMIEEILLVDDFSDNRKSNQRLIITICARPIQADMSIFVFSNNSFAGHWYFFFFPFLFFRVATAISSRKNDESILNKIATAFIEMCYNTQAKQVASKCSS